ncbi:serine/threonine protein kinase [Deinococcus detaillensis]|uniref:Serine/threonine protein kinase n=1 Tax=Deinococcus detaillensis TaxID=2592048 RepID=A0A553UKT7_9DEIO|nr:serine/threonine-protein kinase [Deinococcus detaillensis]TSA80823.1 serine/threonine protein kinase [Deinococcus detaillensis]
MSLAGTRLADHYTLIRPLGQGASSLVYVALGDDGEAYTVKLFAPPLADHAAREARMRVRGPHLAEVMMLSEVAGQPAVVLRFTKGTELFGRYRFRPALERERPAFVRTLSDVLEGLAAMHAGGWLHRDVKADNILVQKSGAATLLDYDLSGPIGETFAVPLRIGTAAFQSPEAQRGEVLGPQSDLYGVGVLLYWGLMGELPADGQLDLAGEPLAKLCVNLLEADPAKRPSDAEQVRAELLRSI